MRAAKQVQFAPDTVFTPKKPRSAIRRVSRPLEEMKMITNEVIKQLCNKFSVHEAPKVREIEAYLKECNKKINAPHASDQEVYIEIKAFKKGLNTKLYEWETILASEATQPKPLLLNAFRQYITKSNVITVAICGAAIFAAFVYSKQRN